VGSRLHETGTHCSFDWVTMIVKNGGQARPAPHGFMEKKTMARIPTIRVLRRSDKKEIIINETDFNKKLHIASADKKVVKGPKQVKAG